jgi:integrase
LKQIAFETLIGLLASTGLRIGEVLRLTLRDRGPALHSLRHTFAVRRLITRRRAGSDVRSLLPHLAVYLGHLSLTQTYHYLTATPELLSAAASMFEGYADPGGDQ